MNQTTYLRLAYQPPKETAFRPKIESRPAVSFGFAGRGLHTRTEAGPVIVKHFGTLRFYR
jgi:hypothetical protein